MSRHRQAPRQLYRLVLCLATCLACAQETVVHKIDEREANRVLELLAENNINGSKVVNDDGRTVSYSVEVPKAARMEAIRLLNHHEMPRRADTGYLEIFKDGGLIPTSGEEHAKTLAALEGEIEKQLKLVDGILDAQVQVVMPEESTLHSPQDVRPPATASVTVRYLPTPTNTKPLSEQQIQTLVAGGVERMQPGNVVVVMAPAVAYGRKPTLDAKPAGKASWLGKMSESGAKLGFVLSVLITMFASGIAFRFFFQLQGVRRQFSRLQDEINRARQMRNGDAEQERNK